MNARLSPQAPGAPRLPEDAVCTCPPGTVPASCPTCRAFRLVHSEIRFRQRIRHTEPRRPRKGGRP